MARKHSGMGNRPQGVGDPGKRYTMDCREADKASGCSLVLSGSMEEVIQTGEMHARKTHGMRGSEEDVRGKLRENIHEEKQPKQESAAMAGRRTEPREDMPPA